MAVLVIHILSSASLFSLGLWHLVCSAKNNLRSPREFAARPWHPFTFHPRLRHLQLHLVLAFLSVAILYTLFVTADSDPLVKGSTPVYRFSSLQSAAVLLFFLVLSLSILLSETTTLFSFPSEFFFSSAASPSTPPPSAALPLPRLQKEERIAERVANRLGTHVGYLARDGPDLGWFFYSWARLGWPSKVLGLP